MAILKIHDRTRDRYHALTISTVWDREKVRGSRALVVGAGALGNEVAKNLSMMGVALIVAVDRDTVEMANLTRSIFFRESDHGQSKVTALAARLREFNPDVEVIPLHGDLEVAGKAAAGKAGCRELVSDLRVESNAGDVEEQPALDLSRVDHAL